MKINLLPHLYKNTKFTNNVWFILIRLKMLYFGKMEINYLFVKWLPLLKLLYFLKITVIQKYFIRILYFILKVWFGIVKNCNPD